jgi:hypothetical protein
VDENEPQSLGDYSPYVDKQYTEYINDINNGVYVNNSLTLVNFDLGQIYNSNKYLDTSDLYCVLPITMVSDYQSLRKCVEHAQSTRGPFQRKRWSQPFCSRKRRFGTKIREE